MASKCMRSIPLLCLGLAACTGAPTPVASAPPLKRTATAIASPSPAPVATPGNTLGTAAVRRMQRVAAWVKRQGSDYQLSFLFYDTQDTGVFFDKEPIAVDYALYPSGGATAIASGSVTMANDAQTFPVEFSSAPPSALDADVTAHLPDGRVLHARSGLSID